MRQLIQLGTLDPDLFIYIFFEEQQIQGVCIETLALNNAIIKVSGRPANERDLQKLITFCYPGMIGDRKTFLLINGLHWNQGTIKKLLQEIHRHGKATLFARLIVKKTCAPTFGSQPLDTRLNC